MTAVFISYRREDSEGEAGRLYDHLVAEFGRKNVFRDRDVIGAGDDFAQVIDQWVSRCDVLLAVIGKTWLDCANAAGVRRLDEPQDFVRHEIASALRQGVRVIPVLLSGVGMPAVDRLPADIAALATRNARFVAEPFEDAVALLVQEIKTPGQNGARPTLVGMLRELRQQIVKRRIAALSAIAIALVMFFFAWVRLFDFLTLDTRVESYAIWLGQWWRGVPHLDTKLSIVSISETTEAALGRPLNRSWRAHHAQLIERLREAGAAAIVFDLYLEEASAHDSELAAAVARATRAGTKIYFGSAGSEALDASVRAILANASGTGLMCIGKRIGYAAVVPLAAQRDDGVLSALTLLATQRAAAKEIATWHREILVDSDAGIGHIHYSFSETLKSGPRCEPLREGDLVANLFITLTPLAALRAPATRVDYQQALQAPAAELRTRFQGKTVLVGPTIAGVDSFRVQGGEQRFGVELHADAINSLRLGLVPRPLSAWWQFSIMLLMGGIGAAIAYRWQTLSRLKRACWLFAAIGVYVLVCIWFSAEFGALLNVIYHVGALLLAYWSVAYVAGRWWNANPHAKASH